MQVELNIFKISQKLMRIQRMLYLGNIPKKSKDCVHY